MKLLVAASFWSGVTHPVLGLDHLVAMVAVGVVSARLGGRALFVVPVTFVVAMAIGGIVGLSGMALVYSETWIASSLVILELFVVLERKVLSRSSASASVVAVVFVMAFGTAHGNAHGLEIPLTVAPASFVLGFLFGHHCFILLGCPSGMCQSDGRLLLGRFGLRECLRRRWVAEC